MISFLLDFLPISYMHYSSPPIRATCHARLFLLGLIILITLGEECKLIFTGDSDLKHVFVYVPRYCRYVINIMVYLIL
jgi:hypothetical protein